jgi:hypothetical protein
MIYVQILLFILVNAPKIYEAIKELIAIWKTRGPAGKQAAKACLADLKRAKAKMPKTADKDKVFGDIVHLHKAKCGAAK